MAAPGVSRTLEGVHDTDHYQLLLMDGHTVADLRDRVTRLIDLVREPACGTLDTLAVNLQHALTDRPMRTAVIADSAGQARERLTKLAAALRDDNVTTIDVANGVFAGRADSRPAIGYLFPGQGANNETEGSALTRRFETARDFYRAVTIPTAEGLFPPSVFQQQIVASSLAGLRVLNTLGIKASMAAGHSLGELTALHWAGAMSESALLTFVAERGQIVARACTGTGAMMGVAANPDEVKPLLLDEPVVIVGHNNPGETVVAGPAEAVARVQQAALAASLKAERMPVRDAFHSPAMAPAADGLRAHLAGIEFGPLERAVASTVTGDVLPSDTDLPELLVRQICEPVWFSQAVERMADKVNLLIEVGPSEALSYHASLIRPDTPVVPLSTDSTSLYGVLSVAAAAYVLGAPVLHDRLVDSMSEHASETFTTQCPLERRNATEQA